MKPQYRCFILGFLLGILCHQLFTNRRKEWNYQPTFFKNLNIDLRMIDGELKVLPDDILKDG